LRNTKLGTVHLSVQSVTGILLIVLISSALGWSVTVMCTSWMSRPRENDEPGDGADASEVDHPDGFFDVEVVEYGTAVNAVVSRLTVDSPRRVTVHPLVLTGVSLVLATIVYERLLLERKVLHWTHTQYIHQHA